MNDPTDDTPEVEDRLRRALASRAASVEPRIAGVDPAGLAEHAAAARSQAARRRMVLSAAAVVAVVALAAGAFELWPDSDDDTDVATGGGATTTVPGEPDPAGDDEPAIWPLPSMSIIYETPQEAADAFMTGYLDLEGGCEAPSDQDDGSAAVRCRGGREADDATTIATRLGPNDSWVVTGATSNQFEADVAFHTVDDDPTFVSRLGARVTPDDHPFTGPVQAEIRPLGSINVTASAVAETTSPGEPVAIELIETAAVQGPHVLVVLADGTASAEVFDPPAAPATTTTTTEPATDDGVPGWPGPVARVFDEPEAAAQAFVEEVLRFADPALADATGDDTDMVFEYAPRPTATVTTHITVHDTGNVRGWVVTGLESSTGTIDQAAIDGTTVTVSGSAQAFEATVTIVVLDEQGTVLGESFTMAGSTEVLPYQGTVEFDPSLGTPFWVLIAEGDASGDGLYVWATTANL